MPDEEIPWPEPPDEPAKRGGNGRHPSPAALRRYVEAALDAECASIASATGGRNNALNRASYRIGQLVAATWAPIEEPEAVERLFSAATAAGLTELESRTTIRSGLRDGAKEPRPQPEGRDPEPPTRWRRPSPPLTVSEPEHPPLVTSQLALGERFAVHHGWFAEEHGTTPFVFCREWADWLAYHPTEGRWKRDEAAAYRAMADLVRECAHEALDRRGDEAREKALTFCVGAENLKTIQGALTIASKQLAVEFHADGFDTREWHLNTPNGVLDLRTGELGPHSPTAYHTAMTPVSYVPNSSSDLWERYLDRALGDDADLRRFLAQVAGYCLTGSTREEKLFFVHGPTRSGKSTFLTAMQAAVGPDYAMTADFETFLAGRRADGSGPKENLAGLAGRRLVVSVETNAGVKLAEGLVKMLTGGDKVRARFLRENSFEFTPRCKLLLAANDRPRARADDDALWERIVEVPFPNSIPKAERDPSVKERLTRDPEHLTAILAWAVRGCLDWVENGLLVPKASEAATEQYRRSQEPLARFVEECCEKDPEESATWGNLFAWYEKWTREQRVRDPLGPRAFSNALTAMGFQPDKDQNGVSIRHGLKLFMHDTKSQEAEDDSGFEPF